MMYQEIIHVCVYGVVGELVIHTILLTLCAIVIFRHFSANVLRKDISSYGIMLVTLYALQSLITFFITENNPYFTALYMIVFLCLLASYLCLLLFLKGSKFGVSEHIVMIAFIVMSGASFVTNALPHFTRIDTLNGFHRLPGLLAAVALFVLVHQSFFAEPHEEHVPTQS
jgi:hypothetical protein